jgi:hypothetical protein
MSGPVATERIGCHSMAHVADFYMQSNGDQIF